MDDQTATVLRRWPSAPGPASAPLSTDERWRLTLYKWRYTLESQGFTTRQAQYLSFLRWLHSHGAAAR